MAFAVWTAFAREPPLNCRLAVLNTFLMAPLESGDFWFGNVVLFKQDILVCHVFMAADFCFVIAAFENPREKKKQKTGPAWTPDREVGGARASRPAFNALTCRRLIYKESPSIKDAAGATGGAAGAAAPGGVPDLEWSGGPSDPSTLALCFAARRCAARRS